jgi:diadenosine tetraphosphate (Ap4A) HIT family hydrolase
MEPGTMTTQQRTCRTCELVERRDRGDAPRWDCIWRTPSWDLVHASGTSHAGWLVLVSRAHRSSIADLSPEETAELGPLLQVTSQALAVSASAAKTYVAQFAEHPLHDHVHFHVIARRPDHPAELVGPRVFDAMGEGVDEVSVAERNAIADRVAAYFSEVGISGHP